MNTALIAALIPAQEKGSQSDTHHSVTKENDTDTAAFYDYSRKRLLDVNQWHRFAGDASATFQLTDASGREVNRPVARGDYFKIGLPAPKDQQGDGFDWVQVEDVFEKKDADKNWRAQVIRVRPAPHPSKEAGSIAHFFDDEATSTFIVHQSGHVITASVHGRNEHVNTDNDNLADQARNALVAIGAMLGLSRPQWKSLVKGLLEEE